MMSMKRLMVAPILLTLLLSSCQFAGPVLKLAGGLLLSAAPSVVATAIARPEPDADKWDGWEDWKAARDATWGNCREWSRSWPRPPWPPDPQSGDVRVRWCWPEWECDTPISSRPEVEDPTNKRGSSL